MGSCAESRLSQTPYAKRRQGKRAGDVLRAVTRADAAWIDFLTLCRQKGEYSSKASAAESLYALLAKCDGVLRLKSSDCIRQTFLAILEGFLKELKRTHVNISSRLGRDKKGDNNLTRCRTTISHLANVVRKRIQVAKGQVLKPARDPEVKATVDASMADLRHACPKYALHGVRHLCPLLCFYREFEPSRKMKALEDHVTAHNRAKPPWKPPVDLSGWYAELQGKRITKTGEYIFNCVYISPRRDDICNSNRSGSSSSSSEDCQSFSNLSSVLRHLGVDPIPPARRLDVPKKLIASDGRQHPPESSPWKPPESPFGLIEELFWDDEWKLLVCCMLMNQTTRLQVDTVLWKFFEQFPSPQALIGSDPKAIEATIAPLGIHRRRTQSLLRFSREFLMTSKETKTKSSNASDAQANAGRAWKSPRELHGIGAYAEDAYNIFHKGLVDPDKPPNDHALNWYFDWLLALDQHNMPSDCK